MSDRIPPSNLDAESAILSLCMIDTELFRKVSSIVRPGDFYSRAHHEIFAAIFAVYQQGGQPDVVRVASWLKDNNKIDLVGGLEYLTSVLNSPTGTANAVQYARIVRDKARVRDLIAICQETTARGYAPHGDDSEFLVSAGIKIRDITRVVDRTAIQTNKHAITETFKEIERNINNKGVPSGIHTGIRSLDAVLGGIKEKELVTMAARPGGGKSALLMQLADHIASSGSAVCFFSMEMTSKELCKRQLAMRTGVDSQLMDIGELTKDMWAKVTKATQEIHQLPMLIDETPDLTAQQVRERAMGAIDDGMHKKQPIVAIFVDYLQRMGVPESDKRKARVEVVGDMAKSLKDLAKESGVPVIAAAQLRRAADKTKGTRPTMDDLRESGAIESESDKIILINRPHQYDYKAKEDEAELIVAKNRHGRVGLVNVQWQSSLTLFKDSDGH